MSVNLFNTYNTPMRFSGIASGLDTETIVKNLMRVEQLKVDRLLQSKQIAEWKRDDYRSIYDVLKKLKDNHFDVLNTSSYMLSSRAYNSQVVSSNNEGIISAVIVGDTTVEEAKIEYVESLATPAKITGAELISGKIMNSMDLEDGAKLNDRMIKISLDGVTKEIKFTRDYADIDSLISDFQGLLDDAFGFDRIILTKQTADGKISLDAHSSIIKISGGDAAGILGFTEGSSNRINLDASLSGVSLKSQVQFGGDGKVSFKINDIEFSFDSTATLRDILTKVNNSAAGVKLSYSSLTDQFLFTAIQTGEGKTINIENIGGNLFGENSAIGITELVGSNGTNAVFSYNGKTVVRSTNTISIDNIQYTLNKAFKASEGPVTISIKNNEDQVFDRIKGFVDNYNETIDQIHKVLNQEQFRDFPPLTDEQKAEMTEKEIERWEDKAHSGLLRGDKMLNDIVNKMRRALIDTVEGSDISLFTLGISTGTYLDKGKLKIDEGMLREAIKNNGDKIEKLFANRSEINYSPSLKSEERAQRYKESGLMYRISDILNDYIRTTRADDGKKGMLLEKAGIVGDLSEYKNLINEEIDRINKKISDTMRILQSKEDSYWRKFTAMEKAIEKMNSQSAWLMQQTMGQ